MSKIIQIRLSGFGGQGVVLTGTLFGEAGVVDGKFVAGSNSYGAQARGSGCKSEIVFSQGPIDFPHLISADILIAMSQGTYDLYRKDMTPGTGVIIYDDSQVTPTENPGVRQIAIPATEAAIKDLNNKQAANMVLLGALVAATQVVSVEAVEKAMEKHVSERFRKANLAAFKKGMELGKQALGGR